MPGDGTSKDALPRQFEAAIASEDLADLHDLAGSLLNLGSRLPTPPPRPELRRPRRSDPAIYRLRVDLDHAHPPIWRRLDVRSDLTLDAVHQVLQAAFSWTDSHLHRFALGGSPFDFKSQVFLCPYDAEEGEDDRTPESEVRLDETVQEPGDVLRYVYDYGDSWELTLRLEKVLPARADSPAATCVDGRRAAPPEDCGGITGAADLAEVLDDPAHFDAGEVNGALQEPSMLMRGFDVHPRLMTLLLQLRGSAIGDDFARRVASLAADAHEPPPDDLAAALHAHLWFLERVGGHGLELTPAGYLKPDDVTAASEVVPTMADWIGKGDQAGAVRR
jgi:hypothetical protein